VSYDNLLVTQDGPVCVIAVNRPKALNALNPATLRELLQAITEDAQADRARVVILTGAGERAFVAGADISAMAGMSVVEAKAFSLLGHRVARQFELLPKPVIAAVNGFALGGGLELALACDVILASTSAKFGQPEINLGTIPGFGGSQRLPRRIGVGAARLMIYSGDVIGAEEALRLGLVERIVAPAALMREATELAAALATKAPVALQQAKAAINTGVEIDLDDGCRYEAEAFAVTFGTADRAEGMRAFLDKRPAVFTGK